MADEADDLIVRTQKELETKWQNAWEESKLYHFDPASSAKPYSIDVPPRYASGALHIGHAVHYTHIDFVARYKRQRGYNVFFPLCFDVNGIPIEERVEKRLSKERGKSVTRKDIDRHEFVAMCREFANQNIGEMTRQFKILGESMDPSIYYQTDAEYYRRITQITFLHAFKKGLVYKGSHPINWCPRCMTALAEAEVEYKDRETKLNYIKFKLKTGGDNAGAEESRAYKKESKDSEPSKKESKESGGSKDIIIATTRPELLVSCQAVMVHPDNEKTRELIGKKLTVPIFNKEVKVYEDEAVDPNFGSGVVMVCTIGDKDDLEWIFKYNLPIERVITDDGRMTVEAGKYAGMPLTDARAAVIEDLKKHNLIVKQEPLQQNVGVCWRCATPIEFLKVPQWFLRLMDAKEAILAKSNEINWHPEYMKVRLVDWVNSLKWDWVVSRQRYFATPIPLWECVKCGEVVIAKEESCYVDPTIDKPPVSACPKCKGELKGCEDVFDTWVDSSISPLYNTFFGRDEKLFKKLYPMSLRPQSHDIIRTWAFYTITRCMYATEQKPFEDIMMGGFIMAEDGKPMHTHLGNVVDPIRVLEKYGTDAFRYYASTCALGEDNAFRSKDLTRGIRLITKLFNIEKFIGAAHEGAPRVKLEPKHLKKIDRWILSRYSTVVKNCTTALDEYRFEKAMKEAEYFIWHELADHYIEMVKYRIRAKEPSALAVLSTIGLGVAKLIAPFLPHTAEEIYEKYYKAHDGHKSIHVAPWPEPILSDEHAEAGGQGATEVIAELRRWKAEAGMPMNAEMGTVEIVAGTAANDLSLFADDIKETMRIKSLAISERQDIVETITAVKPNFATLGPTFKKDAGEISAALAKLKAQEAAKSIKGGTLELRLKDGRAITLSGEHFKLEKKETIAGRDVQILRAGEAKIIIEK